MIVHQTISATTATTCILLYFINFSTLVAGHNRNGTISEQSIGGVIKLCSDGDADSILYLKANETISTNQTAESDAILLFKTRNFWIFSLDDLRKYIAGGQSVSKPSIDHNNSLVIEKYWHNLEMAPVQAVMFYGLDSNDDLHNNALMFYGFEISRYKIESWTKNSITTKFLGTFETVSWYGLPDMNDIQWMTTLTATKLLLVKRKDLGFVTVWSNYRLFIINEEDMLNPLTFHTTSKQTSFSLEAAYYEKMNTKRFFMIDEINALVSTYEGNICINDNCSFISDMLNCPPQVEAFKKSIAYWLWHDTPLTTRLVMILLCSFMFVNWTLATSFIFHQLHRLLDLT